MSLLPILRVCVRVRVCVRRGVRRGSITAAVVAAILLIMIVFDGEPPPSPLPLRHLTAPSLLPSVHPSTPMASVYIAVMLYKNWRALRGSDHPGQIPFNLLLRVAIFSFVCVVGIACSFVFLANVSYFAGNIIIGLSESCLYQPRLPRLC